jgi:hypothetical protein
VPLMGARLYRRERETHAQSGGPLSASAKRLYCNGSSGLRPERSDGMVVRGASDHFTNPLLN